MQTRSEAVAESVLDDVRAALTGLFLVTTYASVYGTLQYVGVLPHELFEGQNRPIGIYLEPDFGPREGPVEAVPSR